MDINELERQERQPLSDADLQRILGSDCRVFEYKDL